MRTKKISTAQEKLFTDTLIVSGKLAEFRNIEFGKNFDTWTKKPTYHVILLNGAELEILRNGKFWMIISPALFYKIKKAMDRAKKQKYSVFHRAILKENLVRARMEDF